MDLFLSISLAYKVILNVCERTSRHHGLWQSTFQTSPACIKQAFFYILETVQKSKIFSTFECKRQGLGCLTHTADYWEAREIQPISRQCGQRTLPKVFTREEGQLLQQYWSKVLASFETKDALPCDLIWTIDFGLWCWASSSWGQFQRKGLFVFMSKLNQENTCCFSGYCYA